MYLSILLVFLNDRMGIENNYSILYLDIQFNMYNMLVCKQLTNRFQKPYIMYKLYLTI